MKRRLIILSFFLLFGFALLCAKGQTEKSNSISLSHTNWRPEDLNAWNAIYKEFEKDVQGISIQSTPRPTDRYFSSVEIDAEGGVLDDMVNIWQNRVWNNSMFNRKYFIDLSKSIKNIDKMPEHHKYNFSTDSGTIFAIPVACQYTGILYNKKIFRENGIKVPKTWEEFIAACEKLKSNGVTPLMFQGKDAWHIHYAFDLMMKPYLGGPKFLKSLLDHTYDFKNQDFIKALERFYTLKKFFPKDFMGLGYSDAQNMTATEQVAMWPGCGSWEVLTLKSINPNIELGVFATPVDPGMTPYVTVFTDTGIAISKFSSPEKQEAALKFINWITSPEKGKLINDQLGFFNAWDNDKFSDTTLMEYAALAGKNGENIVSDWAILLSDSSPTATDLIQVGLQDLMNDKKSPQKVAEAIAAGLSVWY
ncbi:extracellular solute-binding protein [Treponema sp. HNW]|uniref:ABC transporter substrate-binding protein n=1 Tax=Treponema sp. HNW TaxID=3116654 RepID=UPI003D0FE570